MTIEQRMKAKGYVKVRGMAILNDVAITQCSDGQVLSPKLTTQQAVDVFNNEFCDLWQLYRKSEQANAAT